MIKISFKKGQGLGNQLWLYTSAKSISEKLNFDLKILDFDNFKGKEFLSLNYQKKNKHEINDSEKESIKNIFHEFNLSYQLISNFASKKS